MKQQELLEKIVRRAKAKAELCKVEKSYTEVCEAINKYGEVTLCEVTFAWPMDLAYFHTERMPSLDANMLVKAIGESIEEMRHSIKMMEEELKGIVEFDDDDYNYEQYNNP